MAVSRVARAARRTPTSRTTSSAADAAAATATAIAAAGPRLRRSGRAAGRRGRRADPGRGHPRHPRQLRLRADLRLPARSRTTSTSRSPRCASNGLRKGDAITGAVRQPRDGERREKFNALVRLDSVNGTGPGAAAASAPSSTSSRRCTRRSGCAWRPTRAADHPDHRPGRADRQGPARPDRRPAEDRQDHDHAGDRQRDHPQQPRVPPDGRAGRRASRRGHRHAALGQGRGHRLDLRPAGRGPHHRRRARHRARQAPGGAGPRRGRPARLDHPPGPRLQPGGPGLRPHPVRWCRLDRALPAEEVLRRRAQHRERRLADHPGHRAGRDRLAAWTR